MSAYDEVQLARSMSRPNALFYIDQLIRDFHVLSGDRLSAEDGAVIGGIGYFNETPVTVIAHRRGKSLDENSVARFGMPLPAGYRKAMRLARQAEKFGRPVLTFIDTPGAWPGINAEETGQASAIAECIQCFAALQVPTIGVVIGEGGSGGALAIAVTDRLLMLEHSIYSVVSPEACASILWKAPERVAEAAEALRFTAADLYAWGICDEVLAEPPEGASFVPLAREMAEIIERELRVLKRLKPQELVNQRYQRYRKVGSDGVTNT